jgi:hypothetical protein
MLLIDVLRSAVAAGNFQLHDFVIMPDIGERFGNVASPMCGSRTSKAFDSIANISCGTL